MAYAGTSRTLKSRVFAALITVLAASTASAATPIAWYKLDETSGTSAADSSGNANTGTYTGGATLGASAIRRFGVYYGGNGQSTTAPASATLNTLGASNADFSVAFWIKPNGTTGGWRPMFHKGSTDNERGPGIWFNPGNNRIHFRISTTANWNEGTDSVAALPDGVWSHLAFVKAANKWRCYVNGVLDTEFTLTGTTTGNSGPLYFGDDPWYSGCPCWMDDVRLYTSALTLAEIKALYGVVGHWKLDETSGVTAADSTNAGNTGTHANGPVISPSGIIDAAVSFDGVDDYIGVPASASLVASDAVAMSAWIRPAASANMDRMIVNKEGEYEVALTDAGEIKWAIANASPGWAWHQTGVFVPNDRWSHVVVSYDGVEVKTYLNGVLVETYAASGSIGDAYPALNELRIGGRTSNPSGKNFNGRIDDVHVYTRGVSATEVANLHGLVGYWKFDETSGTAIADATIVAAHAAFANGTPTWTNGVRSGALNFNGASDAITNQNFTPPSAGTVAFWFRSNGSPLARQRLFGLGGDWEMWQDPDGIVRCDICGDGDTGGFKTPLPLSTAGRWYHVAAVFDSATDAYSLYVNGKLEKTGTSTSGLNQQAAAKLSFGVRTGTIDRFNGPLDDFRIYSRKLTSPEIYEIFGMVAWYKLDETSGAVAADSTGLGRDGAYSGGPTLGMASNGNVALGTAVDFTGTNYVQVAGLYDKSASVSVAAWAKLDASDSSGAEIFSIGDYFLLRLQSGSPGASAYYYNGSSWPSISASQSVLNTGWHHFAAVLNENGTFKLYVDGNEAASAAATPISYAGLGANSRMASHANGQTTFDLDGRVDDVRVFNRAMQPDEVQVLYQGTKPVGIRVLTWTEVR